MFQIKPINIQIYIHNPLHSPLQAGIVPCKCMFETIFHSITLITNHLLCIFLRLFLFSIQYILTQVKSLQGMIGIIIKHHITRRSKECHIIQFEPDKGFPDFYSIDNLYQYILLR